MSCLMTIIYQIKDKLTNGADLFAFRNEAEGLIEAAFTKPGVGKWEVSVMCDNEFHIGFIVTDPSQAEIVLRQAVSGSVLQGDQED